MVLTLKSNGSGQIKWWVDAALVASMNINRSGREIKQLIMDNVQVKPKYAGFVSTSGLIDVEKTIKAAAASGNY